MFSGPADREDGLAACFRQLGAVCVEHDILNSGPDGDLADKLIFDRALAKLRSARGSAWGPPCRTFSRARSFDDRGPPPLRGPTGKDRYGLADLSAENAAKVRTDTALAVNTAAGLDLALSLGQPFVFETPLPAKGVCSMIDLPEFEKVLEHPGVLWLEVDQCRWGAPTRKPTLLLLHLVRPPVFAVECSTSTRPAGEGKTWRAKCDHEPQWFWQDGAWTLGPHLPLIGKSRGSFRTKAAAAYPAEMNRWIASALSAAALPDGTRPLADPVSPTAFSDALLEASHKQASGKRARVHFDRPLKPIDRDLREEEDQQAIGGLRRCAASVARLPVLLARAAEVAERLDRYLEQKPEIAEFVLGLLGRRVECICKRGSTKGCVACHLSQVVQKFREEFLESLGSNGAIPQADLGDLGSALRPEVFRAWRGFSGDPDDEVERWLVDGAPCGVLESPAHRGIFPVVDDLPAESAEELEGRHDRPEPEDEQLAVDEIQGYVAKGFVRVFPSEAAAREYLGRPPVFSRIMVLSKTLPDGHVKKRVILDCKSSGVSGASVRGERSFIPRVVDVAFD